MAAKQFSSKNPDILKHDVKFYTGILKEYFELYAESKATSAEEIEAKALICATLSGFGLAMHMHFASGVHELIDGGSCEPEDPLLIDCATAGALAARVIESSHAGLEDVAITSAS